MSEAAAREGSVRLGLPGTGGRQLAEGVVLVALTILILWLRARTSSAIPTSGARKAGS